MVKKLRELCLINVTSGDESRVREYIKANITADEITVDNLGNLIVFKKGGKTPKNKIMFAAHMDEVGFMITDISEDGSLRFGAVGGINPDVVVGRAMRFESVGCADGEISGVVGTKAIHQQSKDERAKMPSFDEMYLDIGAGSKEEAENLVSRGNYAYFDA